MRLKDFIAVMERIAPSALALPFDNVGLLVGPDHDEVRRVLVCLDLSVRTAQEAVKLGADLVLSHHPHFITGIKRILPTDPETAAACMLLRHGIGHFAAHTNLDTCAGGVNDALAERLSLTDVDLLPPEHMGRIGMLEKPMPLKEFTRFVNERLETNAAFVGEGETPVSRIAVLGGSGGDVLFDAASAGADVLLTGEIKHHMAYQAEVLGINVVAAGHYETESVVLSPLIARLQRETNDVQYSLTRSEHAPFRRC